MGLVYGGVAALCWGSADFMARGAGERLGALRTVLYAQMISLVGLLALVDWRHTLTPAALPMLGLGALLGLGYTLGTVLLYYALTNGRMAVVSPISSSFATVTLALSLLAGAAISPARLAGLLLTVAGVFLVARPGAAASAGPEARQRRALAAAIAAAGIYGVTLWGLQYVVPTLGLWVPVIERNVMGLVVIPLVAFPLRQSIALPPPKTWLSLAAIGVIDTCGTAAYNYGLGADVSGAVAVLGSLFSPITVILAFVILGERLARHQWGGMLLIFAAVTLVGVASHGAAV